MKRFRKLMAFCLVLMMALTVAVPAFAATGYKFTYKGVSIQMGKSIGKNGSKVKKMKLTRKQNGTSCLSGAGYQYKYTRSGLKITADQKKKGGAEYVTSIVITSKSYKTSDGIKVGTSLADLKAKYGSKLKKSGSKYSITSGKDKIVFTIKSNKVKKIEYM